jgi:hypothetical protein
MSRLPAVACPHRKPYPSDLSDEEWAILKPLLPEAKGFGHPVAVDCREILNGIFYLQRSGGQWERMPRPATLHNRVRLLSEMAAQRGLAAEA